MPSTPTPLPDKNTSSAPRSRSSETDVSRARILAPAAISRTALRVIPGSAPSYVAGVRRAPAETRNTFRAVVSTTRPRSFRRSASNAPSASASRRATDSAHLETDSQPLEVGIDSEGRSAVDPDRLEASVAVQEAAILGRDARVVLGDQGAVKPHGGRPASPPRGRA